MPFFANSPEANIGRSDSKNPATTCKGITANGRPCRRAIGASAQNSPNGKGVIAILSHAAGLDDVSPAAYYCYQHKDQAPTGSMIAQPDGLEGAGRTSIETLMGRLGVVDPQDDTPTKPRKKKQNIPGSKPVKRTTLPQQWQEIPGPLLSVPTDSVPQNGPTAPTQSKPPQRVRPKKAEYHFSFFCCGSRSHHDDSSPPRPRPGRPQASQRPGQNIPMPGIVHTQPTHSETKMLKAWIPDSVKPSTHSALMTELSKPLSQQDRDTGYIYMFWETPTDAPQPTKELTRSLMHDVHDAWEARDELLADPWNTATRFGKGVLSTSDAIRAAAHSDGRNGGAFVPGRQGPTAHPGTIMLKIGRADNVQRRMDQWTRQCGKNITLLRYYPYVSGRGDSASPSPSPSRGVAKGRRPSVNATAQHPGPVPNCARIERLIHVELADQRVMKQCDTCGKQHREWFEVAATRQGIQSVDETIRRWVRWGDMKAKE